MMYIDCMMYRRYDVYRMYIECMYVNIFVRMLMNDRINMYQRIKREK